MKQRIPPIKFLLVCLASLAYAASPPAQTGARPTRPFEGGGVQKVDEAGRRVQDYYDEKESRTPAQRKLDSKLVYALRQRRGETRGVPAERIDLKPDARGRVLVDITAKVSKRLLSKIKRLGGEVVSTSERYHTTRAWLALEKLEALAGMAEVKFIAQPAGATTHGGAVTN